MDAFARSLVRELGGRIRVNTVAPGFFESEMSAVLAPAQRDAIVRRTPSGRLATFESVVPVVLTLLDESIDLHGAIIPVDGGAST
jgi:3-oxoacyl-[acyl-carrier protein] reductase